jgi:hypothetical protein
VTNPARRRRLLLLCGLVAAGVAVLAAGCGGGSAKKKLANASGAKAGVVTIKMATVGDPGNPSVGVIQTFGGPNGNFVVPPQNTGLKNTGIYKTCADAPPKPQGWIGQYCLTVGKVDYTYGIAELETTVQQYVTFLNTVDPAGKNLRQLYIDYMNPTVWPQYGPINYSAGAGAGKHYSVAYPEWADKPFNFGNFRRGARYANSLTNGTVLSKTQSTSGAFKYVTYTVRLSRKTEQGMYDLTKETPTRTASKGFVLASNNEWVKAAYYDPAHGGTDSYWAYPTGPFDPPHPSKLNPGTGDVVNASTQPLSTYNPNDPTSSVNTPGSPPGAAPTWCPSQAGPSCADIFPSQVPPNLYPTFMGNVSTVGQTKTPSPWGTLDQGGNVVEVLDTVAPQPPGYNFLRDWRYYHGGVANASAYQLEISAFGYNPGDHPLLEHLYPWIGFRLAVIGTVK